LRQGDDCRIEISLREGDVVAGRYAFDCGR
jgi:hypothetical protein